MGLWYVGKGSDVDISEVDGWKEWGRFYILNFVIIIELSGVLLQRKELMVDQTFQKLVTLPLVFSAGKYVTGSCSRYTGKDFIDEILGLVI